MESVGFVGAGTIGEHMANRIHKAGYAVSICDLRAEVRSKYAGRGISAFSEARHLASCDYIVVMVANEAQIFEVVAGPVGLMEGLDPTKSPVLIVMSTILPEGMKRLRERLHGTRIRLLDAPVSGGPARAERGELTIMAGGTEADYQAALPLLRTMGHTLFHCGELGAGSLTKLINNVIGVGNLYLAAEAYALAQRLGGDLAKMIPVLDSGTGRNFTSTSYQDARAQFAMFLDPPRGFHAVRDITEKDLQLVRQLARDANISLPVTDGVADGLARMSDPQLGETIFRQWDEIVKGSSA